MPTLVQCRIWRATIRSSARAWYQAANVHSSPYVGTRRSQYFTAQPAFVSVIPTIPSSIRVDKPSIQALERAQGYLKLPNGRTLTGHSHDYKRHGTTTLFAAFEVATGKVTGAHKKRRRRKEFLAFMDEVVATYPKTRLEVILDNLNTHKKNEEWLARHPLVTFHYTPTRASWLNQVEGWFSILQGQSLTGASFTSVEQLKKHIDAFIESYNEDAEPFVWTKSKVHQRRVKGRRLSDL